MKVNKRLNKIIKYLIINIKNISEYKLLENKRIKIMWYNNKEIRDWIKDQLILILGLLENNLKVKIDKEIEKGILLSKNKNNLNRVNNLNDFKLITYHFNKNLLINRIILNKLISNLLIKIFNEIRYNKINSYKLKDNNNLIFISKPVFKENLNNINILFYYNIPFYKTYLIFNRISKYINNYINNYNKNIIYNKYHSHINKYDYNNNNLTIINNNLISLFNFKLLNNIYSFRNNYNLYYTINNFLLSNNLNNNLNNNYYFNNHNKLFSLFNHNLIYHNFKQIHNNNIKFIITNHISHIILNHILINYTILHYNLPIKYNSIKFPLNNLNINYNSPINLSYLSFLYSLIYMISFIYNFNIHFIKNNNYSLINYSYYNHYNPNNNININFNNNNNNNNYNYNYNYNNNYINNYNINNNNNNNINYYYNQIRNYSIKTINKDIKNINMSEIYKKYNEDIIKNKRSEIELLKLTNLIKDKLGKGLNKGININKDIILNKGKIISNNLLDYINWSINKIIGKLNSKGLNKDNKLDNKLELIIKDKHIEFKPIQLKYEYNNIDILNNINKRAISKKTRSLSRKYKFRLNKRLNLTNPKLLINKYNYTNYLNNYNSLNTFKLIKNNYIHYLTHKLNNNNNNLYNHNNYNYNLLLNDIKDYYNYKNNNILLDELKYKNIIGWSLLIKGKTGWRKGKNRSNKSFIYKGSFKNINILSNNLSHQRFYLNYLPNTKLNSIIYKNTNNGKLGINMTINLI